MENLNISPPERNPFKIVWYCRRNTFSAKLIMTWSIICVFVFLIGVLSVYFPNNFFIAIDAFSPFAIEGLSIFLAILSIWVYRDEDLVSLYRSGSLSRNSALIPFDCPIEIREHFILYSLLAEYYSAIMLWILIFFGCELQQIVVLGNDFFSSVIIFFAHILYICLVNLLVLIVAELFIKSLERITNRIVVQTLKDYTKSEKSKKNSKWQKTIDALYLAL